MVEEEWGMRAGHVDGACDSRCRSPGVGEIYRDRGVALGGDGESFPATICSCESTVLWNRKAIQAARVQPWLCKYDTDASIILCYSIGNQLAPLSEVLCRVCWETSV